MIKANLLSVGLTALLYLCGCKEPVDDQISVAVNPDSTPVTGPTHKEKAREVYDFIQAHYRIGNLYKENVPEQAGDNNYCYLWPYVGMLTAGNVLYALYDNRALLDKEFEGLEAFYDDRDSLPAYQAYPVAETSSDHFYDDNGIVAMELIEAYRLTKSQKFLDRAMAITRFIMSGEDDRMGGGLYWLESVAQHCTAGPNCMKAANTSAYASYVTSELYKETREGKYLSFSKRVYHWLYTTLRDPSDNLYWNDINIGTGQVNPTKWTYNAAMMIMAGVNLYEITQEAKYLEHAIATARSAHAKFTRVTRDRLFYQTNDPWFNVELMSAFIKLAAYDATAKQYVDVFIHNADYAWEHARTSDGHFYEDWSGNAPGRYYWLLHQACLIEAYGRAAIFKGEN
ncbi:Glycosyl hydrolase family 76 [Catalinimonas alkaloidigena]|uniref:Glycosyl hydrolase family 76 n=1 Tax=Catalinimonas alkaloidigena TaxID=1075417 RepID=A0A1G9TQZ2_9BACT|nr:glycoside hydrolase family 76 protein [Catalinimonas alkaloidigena]SDM49525.1 Glycosyl hydrolase family 76 [Catalinimonas alkaloidigena]